MSYTSSSEGNEETQKMWYDEEKRYSDRLEQKVKGIKEKQEKSYTKCQERKKDF